MGKSDREGPKNESHSQKKTLRATNQSIHDKLYAKLESPRPGTGRFLRKMFDVVDSQTAENEDGLAGVEGGDKLVGGDGNNKLGASVVVSLIDEDGVGKAGVAGGDDLIVGAGNGMPVLGAGYDELVGPSGVEELCDAAPKKLLCVQDTSEKGKRSETLAVPNRSPHGKMAVSNASSKAASPEMMGTSYGRLNKASGTRTMGGSKKAHSSGNLKATSYANMTFSNESSKASSPETIGVSYGRLNKASRSRTIGGSKKALSSGNLKATSYDKMAVSNESSKAASPEKAVSNESSKAASPETITLSCRSSKMAKLAMWREGGFLLLIQLLGMTIAVAFFVSMVIFFMLF